MIEFRRNLLTAATVVAASAVLAACIVVPAQPYYGSGPVAVAPPAPQMEVIAVAPGPGFFWIGGYWNWVGSRHVWTGGHWEAHRPGYHWTPHQWHRDGSGWRAAPGRWDRR